VADVGSSLVSGKKTVTSAGTRERLANDPSVSCLSVVIQALATNEGEVVVGGVTVVAAKGTHAAPERIGIALGAGQTLAMDISSTDAIYLDVTTSGDGVGYLAILV
jgi:hypothetical protein